MPNKTKIKNVRDLVQFFGGPTLFGRKYNSLSSSVCNWQSENRIPSRLQLRVYLDATHEGLELEPALYEDVREDILRVKQYVSCEKFCDVA